MAPPPARADPPLAEAVDLDRALDVVFGTPPEEFVKARDGVVKRLRAEKRRDEAAEVAALRKPNRLVWALDQLALTDDPTLGELLEIAAEVRAADGAELRGAIEDLREAVRVAASAAARRLDPERPADRADLGAALNAVVADGEALETLRSGRLLEIPPPDPFGLGLAAGPSSAAERPAKAKAPARKKAKGKAESSGRAKAKTAKSAKTAKTGRSGADPLALRRARRAAAAALESAQQAAAAAEGQVREAATAQDGAEAALDAAEAAHQEAGEALEAARFERDEAAAALDEALKLAERAAADEEAAAAALEAAVKAESS